MLVISIIWNTGLQEVTGLLIWCSRDKTNPDQVFGFGSVFTKIMVWSLNIMCLNNHNLRNLIYYDYLLIWESFKHMIDAFWSILPEQSWNWTIFHWFCRNVQRNNILGQKLSSSHGTNMNCIFTWPYGKGESINTVSQLYNQKIFHSNYKWSKNNTSFKNGWMKWKNWAGLMSIG